MSCSVAKILDQKTQQEIDNGVQSISDQIKKKLDNADDTCEESKIDKFVAISSIILQYITSFYWALYTLTTVGYGNIQLSSMLEKLFAIFVMIVGFIICGTLSAVLNSIIESFDRIGTDIRFVIYSFCFILCCFIITLTLFS